MDACVLRYWRELVNIGCWCICSQDASLVAAHMIVEMSSKFCCGTLHRKHAQQNAALFELSLDLLSQQKRHWQGLFNNRGTTGSGLSIRQHSMPIRTAGKIRPMTADKSVPTSPEGAHKHNRVLQYKNCIGFRF